MTNKEKIDQLRIQYKEATSDLDRRLIQIRAELLNKTSKETARPMKLIEDTPPVEYSKNDLKDLF